MEEMNIDGQVWIKKEDYTKNTDNENLTLCIIRTYSSGVWYGYVDYEAENTFSSVIIKKARRIWKWKGAFTLSEMAINGISEESKIAIELPEIKLNRCIELIPVTEKARSIIDNIKNYEV